MQRIPSNACRRKDLSGPVGRFLASMPNHFRFILRTEHHLLEKMHL
jgi:hypothetical protein